MTQPQLCHVKTVTGGTEMNVHSRVPGKIYLQNSVNFNHGLPTLVFKS